MIGLVFDLDGTLIDSVPDIHRIANEVLEIEGLGAISLDETRAYVGHGLGHFVTQVLAQKGQPPEGALNTRITQAFLERYGQGHGLTKLYPDVIETLEYLKKQGHPLAICTNKPTAATQATLDHFGLTQFFPIVVAGDTLAQRKPNPEPLVFAQKELGVSNILFIGDSEVDADTAERARIPFALFTEGYRKTPTGTIPHDHRFSKFSELPGIVATL